MFLVEKINNLLVGIHYENELIEIIKKTDIKVFFTKVQESIEEKINEIDKIEFKKFLRELDDWIAQDNDLTSQTKKKTCKISLNNDLKINLLSSIKPLNGYDSPTSLWVHSNNHTRWDDDSECFTVIAHDKEGNVVEVTEGWTPDQIKEIPTNECIALENKFIDTHVSVYHATTKTSYALDLFYRELKNLFKEGDNKTAWLRCTSTPPGMRYTDIEQIKCKMEQRYSIDNTSNNAWHLLSCNPSLWQNSDYDSQESTVDYFYSNVSVTQLDFSHIIHRILDDMNLLINQKSERKLLIENFHKTVANERYGNQGVIYHYLIPHQLVNDIAYISKENGILDTDNPDALHTLLSLKTPGALVPNHNTLQVRLFVPKLLDPNYAPYLSCKNHMNIDEQFHQYFIKKIQKLAQRAYASCSLVKPVNMQKIETEECKFNQLRFFKRNNVEYSPVAQISQMRNENSMEELSSLFSNESPFDENSFS